MKRIYKVSEVKLTYNPKVRDSQRPTITCADDIYRLLLKEKFHSEDTIQHRETLKVLLLNQSGKVLGVTSISEGGISETSTDVRIILQAAILANASGIILTHNHPSGSLQPSQQDRKLTDRVKDAARLMDLQLLDHIIFTKEKFFSFADQCYIM